MWEELSKDGELERIKTGNEEEDKDRSAQSSLETIFEHWAWSNEEPNLSQVREALRESIQEQHQLALKAFQTTRSVQVMNKRLLLLERYCTAISRRGREGFGSGPPSPSNSREQSPNM